MLATRQRFDHKEWLNRAFRGQVPEGISELLESRDVAANVLEEMMTQWPPDQRRAIERLYDAHRAESELLYGVIEGLFSKHLEQHP
jgi:hypothetical protein